VPADVRAVVDRLDPFPTCVTNARYDVLAWNTAYTKISGDPEPLPVEDRNALWLAFTSEQRRALIVDWDETVRRLVAQYRAAMADHVGEPAWKCLVQRLEQASPEFAAMWHRHDVGAPENLTKRILHPVLGLLTFTHTSLWLGPTTGVRVVSYVPKDDATLETLGRLGELAPLPV
jgi:hypothetical protein